MVWAYKLAKWWKGIGKAMLMRIVSMLARTAKRRGARESWSV